MPSHREICLAGRATIISRSSSTGIKLINKGTMELWRLGA